MFCSCYLFQDIFSTKLRREKLQDSSLIVIQSHQFIMIINKARRPIHILLTESPLLLSRSFIINLYLDQNFFEGAHLYLVACLFLYVRTNQLLNTAQITETVIFAAKSRLSAYGPVMMSQQTKHEAPKCQGRFSVPAFAECWIIK